MVAQARSASFPRPDAAHAFFVALPGTPLQPPAYVVEVELRSGNGLRFEGEAARVVVGVLVARVRGRSAQAFVHLCASNPSTLGSRSTDSRGWWGQLLTPIRS